MNISWDKIEHGADGGHRRKNYFNVPVVLVVLILYPDACD